MPESDQGRPQVPQVAAGVGGTLAVSTRWHMLHESHRTAWVQLRSSKALSQLPVCKVFWTAWVPVVQQQGSVASAASGTSQRYHRIARRAGREEWMMAEC